MNREIFAVFPTEAVLVIEIVLRDFVLPARFLNDGKGMIIVTGADFDSHFTPRSKFIEALTLYDGVAVALPCAVEVNDLVLTDEYTHVFVEASD